MPSLHPIPWCVLAALLAGCGTLPPSPPTVLARDLALPPAVLAAVAGGALRTELPFCDPLPGARGVLVVPLADGGFRLAFTRTHRGWQALASHRLAIVCGADPAEHVSTRTTELPAAMCTHEAGLATEFELVVAPTGGGASLRGELPADLAAAVERAIALAVDPCSSLPGLQEPNLATWAMHRLLVQANLADQAGDRSSAHALRQAAARLDGQGCAGLQAHLADDAERAGQVALATDHVWQALLASEDAGERTALAGRLQALRQRGDDALAWRAAARERLHDVDPELAAAMLHTARRLRAEPALDYRLQSQLHRLRDDADLASASALLAREHAGVAIDLPAFVAELWVLRTPPTPAVALHAATIPAMPAR